MLRRSRGWAWVGLLAAGFLAPISAGEHYHVNEGVVFHAYEVKGQGDFRQPLFRLLSPKNVHGFTTSEYVRGKLVDAGMKPEDSGMFVLTSSREGAKRLYQFMRKGGGPEGQIQTLLTVSEECRQDLLSRKDEFVEIESECYVFPPEFQPQYEHLSPVFCLRDPFTDERLYTISKAEIDEVLGHWENRKKRVMKEIEPQVRSGSAAEELSLVPVGLEGQAGSLAWRFMRDQELGKEVEAAGGKSPKTKGSFIYFQVMITNTGAAPVELKAPDILTGQSAARLHADMAATAAYVKENGFVFKPGYKLEPGKSVELRFVYDVPAKTKDVVIEAYGDAAGAKEVVLLDTGR
ncbi:MAG: hypothetical protein IT449_16290 [Phycisphaerales bacterium]|nr:hypothetical protein [Phycisphaerales bacterium]